MAYSTIKVGDGFAIAPVSEILVDSQSDLASLDDLKLAPGSIAYTADMKSVWRLNLNGQWVASAAPGSSGGGTTPGVYSVSVYS